MSAPAIVNLAEKLASFSDHWNPRIIGRYNGNEIRVAKIEGEFTWHSHAETDELFMVVSGELGIEFRDGIRRFGPGEFVVVPRGTEHKPFAETECHILMLDREGEPNTGVNPSDYTREKLETI
ncbi:cupin domain-containing protein [Sphingomonas cavernae]|uniref:Cupin domain-containing protein n=1 Tax=Sphingomonas cavernae TaxID=2320861 RepID=A0A418W5T7_9SPHN|nr:cupin domain-containing protein [Sphingomonas cavernae]RJF85334.1 cupin domain-containing protein [Sphingomonas cavernae]